MSAISGVWNRVTSLVDVVQLLNVQTRNVPVHTVVQVAAVTYIEAEVVWEYDGEQEWRKRATQSVRRCFLNGELLGSFFLFPLVAVLLVGRCSSAAALFLEPLLGRGSL